MLLGDLPAIRESAAAKLKMISDDWNKIEVLASGRLKKQKELFDRLQIGLETQDPDTIRTEMTTFMLFATVNMQDIDAICKNLNALYQDRLKRQGC